MVSTDYQTILIQCSTVLCCSGLVYSLLLLLCGRTLHARMLMVASDGIQVVLYDVGFRCGGSDGSGCVSRVFFGVALLLVAAVISYCTKLRDFTVLFVTPRVTLKMSRKTISQ